MRWPSLGPAGSSRIPVAGPVEPLAPRRDRAPAAGFSGSAPGADHSRNARDWPRATVPGRPRNLGPDLPRHPVREPPGRECQSGWQLALRAWDDAGVTWEGPHAEAVDSAPYTPEGDPYAAHAYTADPHPRGGDRTAAREPDACHRSEYRSGSASRCDSEPGCLAAPAFTAPPLSAPVASAVSRSTESDELFRAWQGSVREASALRGGRRRGPGAGSAARVTRAVRAARRGRGGQAARIGLPAAVIVTVGAGALLMLTGRANELMAERVASGPLSSAVPGFSASVSQVPGTLPGYPGQNGTQSVAALWSADGLTIAVGYADNHPAVWRRAPDGTWSLVSAAVLNGLPGHLTGVTEGQLGWIAVGSVTRDGTTEPVAYQSADGVTWATLPALTSLAGHGDQFLGVAAGPGGYLVAGRQGSGKNTSAAFWWSGDLRGWSNAGNSGSPGSVATAAVSVGSGFVAVGSEMSRNTVWTSPDGMTWTGHDLAKPDGAQSATLRSVAAGPGGHIVAAGFASKNGSELPVVVASTDGGSHLAQVVLAGQGPATVTGVTVTGDGFAAMGLAGPRPAQQAVTWTSADGLTWSAATPAGRRGQVAP